MKNGDYVTKEYLSQELEKFGKRLKDDIIKEMRHILSVFSTGQDQTINNRLDAIQFYSSLRETQNFEFRIRTLEKLAGIGKD